MLGPLPLYARPMSKLFYLIALLLPTSVLAETASTAQPAGLGAGSLVQMLLGLAAVLILLVGSLWLLKRLTGGARQTNNLVRVVGGTTLGTRERVVVVELGQTWLILGVTPNSINTLGEMPKQALPPTPPAEVPRWLQRMLEKRNVTHQP